MTDPRADKVRRFRVHAMVFLAALVVLIPLNFIVSPKNPWWMYLAFAWAPPLALHWLYAREFIGAKR
ncbi:MAG: 2TM domain-containing protein [Tagaea sp.]|nr:2TM domain-containing protein [Tagaea sp.]